MFSLSLPPPRPQLLKQSLFLAWAELPLAFDASARGSDGDGEGQRSYASARSLSVNVSDMLLHFCARPIFALPGAQEDPLAQLPALAGSTTPQLSSGLHLACLLVGGAAVGANGALLAEPKLNAAQLHRVFQVSPLFPLFPLVHCPMASLHFLRLSCFLFSPRPPSPCLACCSLRARLTM